MSVLRLLAPALLLAGCATVPAPVPSAGPPPPSAAEILTAVREAGRDGVELVVAPLVDPQVADLRERAARAEAGGRFAEAEADIARALALSPGDPDLLQWRAELLLMLGRYEEAAASAQESAQRGPRLGPLCRRNWTLLAYLREGWGEAENAASARAMGEACTVAPPVRM
ncbi:MAG: hypothetical protein KatS3mg127_1627 [Silanimonas sp.]|nr:MAG: hypothetical protein KatS3mg127_1627 [Silanimonas sp.]